MQRNSLRGINQNTQSRTNLEKLDCQIGLPKIEPGTFSYYIYNPIRWATEVVEFKGMLLCLLHHTHLKGVPQGTTLDPLRSMLSIKTFALRNVYE